MALLLIVLWPHFDSWRYTRRCANTFFLRTLLLAPNYLCHQFLSISYWSNSEYWSQKRSQNGNTHSTKFYVYAEKQSVKIYLLSKKKRRMDIGTLEVLFIHPTVTFMSPVSPVCYTEVTVIIRQLMNYLNLMLTKNGLKFYIKREQSYAVLQ